MTYSRPRAGSNEDALRPSGKQGRWSGNLTGCLAIAGVSLIGLVGCGNPVGEVQAAETGASVELGSDSQKASYGNSVKTLTWRPSRPVCRIR
jgi:hypothetical protein